jgi:hypothetical protein
MTANMPEPPDWDLTSHASLLQGLGGERLQLEEQIQRQVLKVIDAGGSWHLVGTALGTTKQAAWERYHQRED